jgi:hypothetical protein
MLLLRVLLRSREPSVRVEMMFHAHVPHALRKMLKPDLMRLRLEMWMRTVFECICTHRWSAPEARRMRNGFGILRIARALPWVEYRTQLVCLDERAAVDA